MLSRKSCFAVLSFSVATGTLISAHASVSYWSASSGLRPDQITPSWVLQDDTPTTPPGLGNGEMTLATTTKPRLEYFEAGPTSITMPVDLTIEFKARFVSHVASANNVSPGSVSFSFGGGLGSTLYLGLDEVWLASGNPVRAVGASGDTDTAFHTYQIELGGASLGSASNVYYDHAVTPILTGAVFFDATLNCAEPEVGFGDSDAKDSGVSEWEYLWHNASRLPINAVPEPTAAALLAAASLLFGCRKFRRNEKNSRNLTVTTA